MNSGRKRFNKKVIAFVLALSMLFSQNALVFATEGADPVSANETVEAPVQTPADGEVTAPAEEPAETPEDEGQPEAGEVPAAAEETPAAKEAVSEDEAAPEEAAPAEEEAEPSTEEVAASGNKISDNTISLSGGSITVSLNKAAAGISENLTYAEGVTVSHSGIEKYTGQQIGFDFDVVLSQNKPGEEKILKEGEDYNITWVFQQTGDVSRNKAKTDIALDEGTITVSISGISKNDAQKGYIGYKNWINITATVVEKQQKSISAADVVVEDVSYNRVTVSNNSKTEYIFVGVVSQNGLTGDVLVQGDYIAPGAKKVLYTYYSNNGKRTGITEKQPLTVVASYESEFVALKDKVKTDGVNDSVYYKTFTSAADSGARGNLPEDGYEKIKMKAVVNKATQTIKISWNPAKKLGYKYYELQRLGKDEETFTTLENWKDNKGGKLLAKTSYTYGRTAVERAEQPAVFKLICYDSGKTAKDSYITTVAPSLLYVEQGYDTNNMEFCFSKLYSDNDFGYRLELAEKNTDNPNGSTEAGKRGFYQTQDKASVYYSTDIAEVKDFAIKKGLSVNALREFFVGDKDLELQPGNNYFCRVKSFYNWHGKTYASAPSNVVSRKAGPAKIYVFDVNGVKYQKPAGKPANKDLIEKQNTDRMNTYLSYGLVEGALPLSSSGFIHRDNEGPDAKSGYIVFLADRISDNELKGFELLRCDSQYGNYKKLKLYKMGADKEPVKYSGLYKWVPTDETTRKLFDQLGMDIYYMQYNNFPPEKTFYYAVRGVYKKNNALGGFGDGYECTAQLDKVQNFYAFDGTIDKINLYWTYDACVKQYWIYKREYTGGDTGNPAEMWDITKEQPIKKLAAKKSGTLRIDSKKKADQDLIIATSENLIGDYVKFVDKDSKKNKVTTGKLYQYVIVPKYNTKDGNPSYNLEKHSDVAYSMATLEGAKIKNFKAANYGVERISLKWDKLKGADAYYMIRTTTDPTQTDDWKNVKGWVISPDSEDGDKYRKAYANCGFVDNTVEVGTRYWYVIFAGNMASASITNGTVKNARSVPLAVTDLKVENGGYRNGANLSWKKNTRDSGYNVVYRVQYRDASNGSGSYGSWHDLKSTTGTSCTDGHTVDRGVMRQYRVISTYKRASDGKMIEGGIREGGKVCSPTYIDISTGSTSMIVGQSMSVSVYPKRDGDPSSVTKIELGSHSGSGAIEAVEWKEEGDHWTVTVRAKYAGTGTLYVETSDPDWTPNTSRSKLKKSITFTVR